MKKSGKLGRTGHGPVYIVRGSRWRPNKPSLTVSKSLFFNMPLVLLETFLVAKLQNFLEESQQARKLKKVQANKLVKSSK